MKYLIAALSGFAITLGAFAGGFAFAIAYLSADVVPVERPRLDASLELPTGVQRVDVAQQDFERVEGPVPEENAAPPDVEAMASVEIDDISTAAIPSQETALNPEHVAWCKERYRSYRPESNSYTSYSGRERECNSPFITDEIAIEAAAQSEEFFNESTSAGMARLEHVESCFARYRSYRPEDNTYQPYGGGPRVPCE